MIVTFRNKPPYQLTDEDKEILLKYKDTIEEIHTNKAIPYLSIECWNELNAIAKKLGYGDNCNCNSGKINTINKLYSELKKIDYEESNRQGEDLAEKGKLGENIGGSRKGLLNGGNIKDNEDCTKHSIQVEKIVPKTKRGNKGRPRTKR